MPVRTATSGGDESDDEDRIRATRERLRERRKHRHHRTRHHHHPPPHAPPPPPPPHPNDKPPDELDSRPRAKSAAAAPTSAAPPRAPAQDAAPLRKRGHSGVGFDRKRGSNGGAPERKRGASGAGGGGTKLVGAMDMDTAGYVVVPPVHSLGDWLFSFAAVPWLLLALVLMAEVVAYSRFSSETAGFLEAAETALGVLGGSRAEDGDGGGVGNRTAGSRTALTEELARGLMRIYCRHRFLWPFSRFC